MENKAWIYFSTTATNLICLILGAASGILAARFLGPEGRGELAVISYFPALMGSIFPLAVPQALTFFISKDRNRQAEFATAGFKISVVLGILGSAIFALVSPRTLAENNRHLSWAVALVCLAAPAMVVNPHLYAIQRGMERFNWVNGMLILTAMGYLFLLLVLCWLNIVSPLLVALSSLLLQMIISALHVWRLGFSTIRCSIGRQTYTECLILGLKFFLPSLALTIFVISDRAILIRTATMEEIGYYSVAFSIAFPLSLVNEVFAQIGFVEIASEHYKGTSVALVVRRFQMAQMVAIVAALMVLPIINPAIRYGFGEEFLAAVPITQLMVAALSLRGLSRSLEFSLRAKNFWQPGIISGVLALVSLVGLSLMWVPAGGVKSFAFALLCAEIISLAILIFSAQRFLKANFYEFWGVRPKILIGLINSVISALKLRVT